MRVKLVIMLALAAGILTGCGKKYNSQSIENRDYAVNMEIGREKNGYSYSFEVADLTDYKGESGRAMKTQHYEYVADSLVSVMKLYFDENERQLDIGHIEKIKLDGDEEDYIDLFAQFSEMTYLPKSVMVCFGDDETEILRRLIMNNIGKKSQ